jgi:hypothetical protein
MKPVVAEKELKDFVQVFNIDPSHVLIEIDPFNVGPQNGRDAAVALAWLDMNRDDIEKLQSNAEKSKKAVIKHLQSISYELSFLRRLELAAKVVAHVTSPHHKKLLNLSHNWLRTFLPHCFAKVNRVSFGLLSMEDCKAALDMSLDRVSN